jgi:hypothetical protein
MMSRARKWRRRLFWLGLSATVAVFLLWGLLIALMRHWVAEPPSIPVKTDLAQLSAERRGDRVYLGKNWFGRREGLPVLYLTGTPLEMGYANGRLTQELIRRQEQTLVDLFHRIAPYRWTQFLLKFAVVYKNRHLSDHVTLPEQIEMLGLTLGCPDPHPEVGPYYHRILNYHAAQDISYMMRNSPLLRGGCTAFGAWGPHTREGRLLLGRNFDWEADPVFDQDRLVILCEPAEGIPFVSLAWAGMVGCVSGMNREGLAVTVNGAPSHLPGDAATPTCLVAREVLQYARTIAEAVEILRRRQIFVSALFLVGSRQDGRCVVVEKTPDQMAVREAGGEPFIICPNHFLTPPLKDTPLNRQYKEMDTSVSRADRLEALLKQAAGSLDPTQCAAFLRDRRLPGDRFAGNGHRGSLNPLIATHAVIMDLTRGIFWAAAPPHQLGRFVAFDVNGWEKVRAEESLAEDPLLASGEYKRYLNAREKLDQGWKAVKQRAYQMAADCAHQAETNNPGFYENAWLLAESFFHQGQYAEAARACQAASAGQPALAQERARIKALAGAIADQQAAGAGGAQP